MKTGDNVRVTYCGSTIEARIVLASPDGASLMLSFDGALGNGSGVFLGAMPVLRDDAGAYRDLVRGAPVHIVAAGAPANMPPPGSMPAVDVAALVDAGSGEHLVERARHIVVALAMKPHETLTEFDVAEACEVIARLAVAHEAEVKLLRELRSARPWVLSDMGEAWIERIDEVLRDA